MKVHEGPSALNGDMILGIVTGEDRPSANRKTGPMAQLYILAKDRSPAERRKAGDDLAYCGECAVKAVCYVNWGWGVQAAWKRSRGLAPALPERFKRPLRLGAAGDPGALPLPVLAALTARAPSWTGYSQQWESNPGITEFCMASVSSRPQAEKAWAKGYRTYRMIAEGEELAENEILCPNTTHGTQCVDCTLCDGTRDGDSRPSIAIHVHGNRAKNWRV